MHGQGITGKGQHPSPSTRGARGAVHCPVLSRSITPDKCLFNNETAARTGRGASWAPISAGFRLVPHPFHHRTKLHVVVSADGRASAPHCEERLHRGRAWPATPGWGEAEGT